MILSLPLRIRSKRIKWDSNKLCEYNDSFLIDDVERVVNMFEEVDVEGLEQDDIDSMCKSLSDVLINPAKSLGMVVEKSCNTRKQKEVKSVNQPWFSKECIQRRSEYIKLKNRLCKLKSVEAIDLLKIEARKYKRFIRKTRRSYYKNLHGQLRSL